jgi:hypothetical protein
MRSATIRRTLIVSETSLERLTAVWGAFRDQALGAALDLPSRRIGDAAEPASAAREDAGSEREAEFVLAPHTFCC